MKGYEREVIVQPGNLEPIPVCTLANSGTKRGNFLVMFGVNGSTTSL